MLEPKPSRSDPNDVDYQFIDSALMALTAWNETLFGAGMILSMAALF